MILDVNDEGACKIKIVTYAGEQLLNVTQYNTDTKNITIREQNTNQIFGNTTYTSSIRKDTIAVDEEGNPIVYI